MPWYATCTQEYKTLLRDMPSGEPLWIKQGYLYMVSKSKANPLNFDDVDVTELKTDGTFNYTISLSNETCKRIFTKPFWWEEK